MPANSDDVTVRERLEELGAATVHVSVHAEDLASTPPANIEHLGEYRVTGALGAGGMGQILQVRDEDIGREMAAKVIRTDLGSDAVTLQKFVQEARVTGQLEHPNIVPVHAIGLTAEGRAFFTMKRVEGDDLAQIIRAQRTGEADPRSLLALLRIFDRVCDAVRFAHARKVIHRDLKPANIMVGAFGETLVMDWGLARVDDADDPAGGGAIVAAVDEQHDDAAPLRTLDGTIMGTPCYMPPEQASGEIDKVDHRADVYALGAILYELLTLRPPFDGDTPHAVLRQVRAAKLIAPRERAPERTVPWELEAVVLRAMSAARSKRYQSVRALQWDITAYIEGRLLSAAEYSHGQRVVKRLRRMRPATVVVLSILFALGVGGWQWQEATDAREEASWLREDHDRAVREREKAVQARSAAYTDFHNKNWELRKERDAAYEQHDELASVAARIERVRELWWTPPARDEEGRLTGALRHPPTLSRKDAAKTEMVRWLEQVALEHAGGIELFRSWHIRREGADWLAGQRRAYAHYREMRAELEALQKTVGERRDALALRPKSVTGDWKATRARIAASRHYSGLELADQVELEPLGPDPRTGLEEFGHEHSGARVTRGADGELVLREDSAIVFVLIPGGTYRMGASPGPDEHRDPDAREWDGPSQQIELVPFFIAKHELTQSQWAALGGDPRSHWSAGKLSSVSVRDERIERKITRRHPVESVSWNESVERLARVGLQLPTEAQWEVAARGGTTTVFWTGQATATLVGKENLADPFTVRCMPAIKKAEKLQIDSHCVHAPVGSFASGPFGLHDVVGNVREWVGEVFSKKGLEMKADTSGRRALAWTTKWRGVRGGSWLTRATIGRSARRRGFAPDSRSSDRGLRAARMVTR